MYPVPSTLSRMSERSNARGTVWAFIALSMVWGASFLFMKLGLQGLSPAQVVVGRLTLGGAVLVGIMLMTRRSWPRERRIWTHMLVVAITFAVLPYSLFSWAEQQVSSGLASIYNATTPIMTLLMAPLLLAGERLSRTQLSGLFIGLFGVLVLVGPWQLIGSSGLLSTLPGQIACLGATASYGFAGMYLRRFLTNTGYDSITMSAMEIGLAAVIVLIAAPFTARGQIELRLPVVLSIAALGVLGTGLAYIWYNRIIRDWGPARASTVTYLSPVVGVVLGALLLGETVHWYEPAGGAIIVLGILASQGRLRARRLRLPSRRRGDLAVGPGDDELLRESA